MLNILRNAGLHHAKCGKSMKTQAMSRPLVAKLPIQADLCQQLFRNQKNDFISDLKS
jgi:hypothetical protein